MNEDELKLITSNIVRVLLSYVYSGMSYCADYASDTKDPSYTFTSWVVFYIRNLTGLTESIIASKEGFYKFCIEKYLEIKDENLSIKELINSSYAYAKLWVEENPYE